MNHLWVEMYLLAQEKRWMAYSVLHPSHKWNSETRLKGERRAAVRHPEIVRPIRKPHSAALPALPSGQRFQDPPTGKRSPSLGSARCTHTPKNGFFTGRICLFTLQEVKQERPRNPLTLVLLR